MRGLDVTDPNLVTVRPAGRGRTWRDQVLVAGAGDTFFGRIYETGTDDFELRSRSIPIGAN